VRERILILSASAGAGHVRAAQALQKAFAARGQLVVKHIDALDYTSKLFQKIYDDAYIALVRRAPGLVGWLYNRLDRPWRHPSRRLALDRLNTGPMIRLLERVQPDLCVATHFLPAEIIAWLKARGKIRARHAVVITDFDVHAMWLCRDVDRYFVALEETAEYLAGVGVPRDTVRVTGIPIDPIFAEPRDPREVRRRLGLDPERTTVLLTAGGEGVGPLERMAGDLLALDRPWQIVAICGRAELARQRLGELARRPRGQMRLHVVGFTTQMDQWMAAADLLVGKAGALTVCEALARGLPMAIAGPVPGQEERNAAHLLERGAAIRCNNLPTTAWKIAKLLDDPARLARMRAAARVLARPRAAADIVGESLRLLAQPAVAGG
jgi:processive 1,2-diacylglycerol beta-glucosyltransferase